MLLFTLFFLLALAFYLYCRKKLNYWNERGVPNLGPVTPMGDILSCILEWKSVFDLMTDIYRRYKAEGHKYAGFYCTTGAIFMPLDLDLIKKVLVTDYEYFADRGMDHDKKKIPLSDNLFCASQQRWKYLKEKLANVLTPTKLKNVMPIIDNYIKDYFEVIDKNLGTPIDVQDLSRRFSLDVACNFFLGIDEKHIKKNKSPMMEFARQVNESTYTNLFKVLLLFGTTNPGNLFTALIANNDLYHFLHDYTMKAYNLRKQSGIQRKDALNDMIAYYEDENEDFDFQSFVGQTFVLLAGTFETSASALSYIMFALAKCEEYQNRLRKEIKHMYVKSNGNVTFDMINDLPFLDRLLTETLRYYPLFAAVNRTCNKDYKVPGSDLVIEKGTCVVVPVMAIHRDPEHFENPEEFNPDRFLDSKQAQRFLAFGTGIKQCPGRRLAMILMKILTVEMMKQYRMKLNPKTGDKLINMVFTKHLLYKYKNTILIEFYKEPLQL